MSNKNRKFKSNHKSNVQNRVIRRMRFDRHGHLINTMLKPENSSILESNLSQAIDFTSSDIFEEVEEFVFKDEEFNEACENTVIVDDNGQEVSAAAKEEAHRRIVQQGTEDTIKDVIENQDDEYTKEAFFNRAKENVLDRIDFLRTDAEKDNEKTQENNGKSLFGRFSKKVKVYARDILSMFKADEIATKAYEQKITDNAPTVKSKVLWNKCKKYKYQIAAGFASVILLASCVTGTNKKAPEKQVDQTEQKAASTPAPVKTQEVKSDTVIVQTEYSDSLGISKAAWKSTINFDNRTFTKTLDDGTKIDGYVLANQRLTNDVMKQYFDGLTREQVLNAHRYIRSNYPNPDGLEELGIKDSTIINAAKVAKALDVYLGDCDENAKIPQNIADMFKVDQIPGYLHIQALGIDNPCDNAKVKYQKLQDKTISWKEATTIAKDSISTEELPADTVATQKDFIPGGGSVKLQEKDEQKTSTVAASFTYKKSNENFDDVKELRSATAEEIIGRQVKKDKIIMVEVDGTNSPVADATYNKGNNLDNGEVIKNATNEDAASKKVADKDIMLEQNASAQQDIAADQTGFKDLTGEKTDSVAAQQTGFKDLTASADNTTPAAAQQTGFKDLTGEKTDSVAAQTGFKDLTGEKKIEKVATQNATVASVDSTSYEVIAGTDGVELGTPALESVSPRGGYNHTDVSLANIEFAKKTLGEDVYNTIVENASRHKEWLERGSFAEGLTPEELAVITAVRTKVFPYAKSTSALRKTVICEDNLSVEMTSQVADAIKKVNQNYTIDGVIYNQPTNTVSVKHNGCDEKETVNIEHNNISKVTHPSGPKLPRMFKIVKQVQQAFGIGGGSVEYATLPQEVITQTAAYTYDKSNEGFNSRMTLRDAEQGEVLGRQVQANDRVIMVEVDGQNSPTDVATYKKSNEKFGRSKQITTVSVNKATGNEPKNRKILVEQETAQAFVQRNGKGIV